MVGYSNMELQRNTEIRNKLAEVLQEVEHSLGERAKYVDEIRILQQVLDETNAECAIILETNDSLRERQEELEKELALVRSHLDASTSELNTLRDENQTLHNNCIEIRSQFDGLKIECRKVGVENDVLRQQLQEISATKSEAVAALDTKYKQLCDVVRTFRLAGAQCSCAADGAPQNIKSPKEDTSKSGSSRKRSRTLSGESGSSSSGSEDTESEYKRLLNIVGDLRRKNKHLIEDLDEREKKCKKYRKRYEKAEEEAKVLRKRLKKVRDETTTNFMDKIRPGFKNVLTQMMEVNKVMNEALVSDDEHDREGEVHDKEAKPSTGVNGVVLASVKSAEVGRCSSELSLPNSSTDEEQESKVPCAGLISDSFRQPVKFRLKTASPLLK